MNIKTNSKKVKKRDIFIALKGDKYDGHDYIKEAISNANENKKINNKYNKYDIGKYQDKTFYI